jgi:hypothetical protein
MNWFESFGDGRKTFVILELMEMGGGARGWLRRKMLFLSVLQREYVQHS